MRCRQINLLKNATNYCIKKRNKEDGTMGVEVGENRNRNVGRESVNRRPLIAKLLDDVCLLLF